MIHYLVCNNGHPLIETATSEEAECPLCAALDKVANLEFTVADLEEKVRILEARP